MNPYYTYYKSHGICVTCGQENAMPGRVRCWRCLASQREHEAEYRERRGKCSEVVLIARRERDAAKRAERRASGLCPNCGRKREDEAYALCEKCRQSAKRSATRRRRNDGVLPSGLRGDGLFCAVCLGLVEQSGNKLCDRCATNNAKNLRTARAAQDRANHPWKKINYQRKEETIRP